MGWHAAYTSIGKGPNTLPAFHFIWHEPTADLLVRILQQFLLLYDLSGVGSQDYLVTIYASEPLIVHVSLE